VQTFPTSAQVIYDELVADTALASLLGTYTFGSGGPLPALSIVSPGQNLPATRSVSGLECVIHDVGNTTPKSYVSSPADMVVNWQVFLIAWEPSTGADLQAATELICSKFANSYSTQTVAVSDGLGALVQNKIIIRSDSPILG
jgi:hypothetical protein